MLIALDNYELLEYLPHRYPFLLLDRVLELEPHKRLKAIKNVTYNEPFFQGHFPHYPVFPGALIIEAMAQGTGVVAFYSSGIKPNKDKNHLYLFVGADKARFKRSVVPGDQMEIEVELLRVRRNIWKFACTAKVNGELACSADLMGAMEEREH